MKTVLLGILNWGLGHATRCTPIIKLLESKGVNIIVASDGIALSLLKTNFPTLKFVELPSYNVNYQAKGSFILQISKQLPKLLKAIKDENRITEALVAQYNPDFIISDNRFGFYHHSVPSCFITHQLFLKPKGLLSLLAPILNQWNHHFISKFTEVWVPDIEGENNLSGELSHQPFKTPKRFFIGWLSQFQPDKVNLVSPKPHENSDLQNSSSTLNNLSLNLDIAVILSGPEPQRSILEEIILPQLNNLDQRVILVRGLPKGFSRPLRSDKLNSKNLITISALSDIENNETIKKIIVKDYANKDELSLILNQTKVVIARTGYTTLMDLAVLKKKALLIPTPGQMEQEYLADRLKTNALFFPMNQDELDILMGIKRAISLSVEVQDSSIDILSKRIDHYLSHQ